MYEILLPIAAILLSIVVIGLILSDKNAKSRSYDERQVAARGSAYAAAFWVLLTYVIGSNLAETLLERPWCTPATQVSLSVVLSIGTFGIYSIAKDAFIQPGQRPLQRTLFFVLLGIANVLVAVAELHQEQGGFITPQGLLDLPVPLTIGVIMLVIAAILLWKARRAARDA